MTERIGVPAVDAVLEQVESVGLLPIGQQVAVYERAQEQLRRALDVDPADVDSGDMDADVDAGAGADSASVG